MNVPDVGDCERFRVRLQDALDARDSLEGLSCVHAAGCRECSAALAAFAELDRVLATEPAADPPADLAAAVLRDVKRAARRARAWTRLAAVAGVAAVLLLGVGIDLAAGSLARGAANLLEDGRSVAQVVEASVLGLRLDALSSFEVPRSAILPGPSGPLASGALAAAAALLAAETVFFRRARRAGGPA
jgi:hypothetical protein